MKYFGTAFTLTLGSWRLRVRVDLDDEPDDGVVAHHYYAPARAGDKTLSSRS
jgi:hypothetical protein